MECGIEADNKKKSIEAKKAYEDYKMDQVNQYDTLKSRNWSDDKIKRVFPEMAELIDQMNNNE